MMELIKGLPAKVIGITVTGRVTKQECHDVLIPAMERSLKKYSKIRLYYILGSRFPGSTWDELDFGSERAAQCERVAIVTDVSWVRMTVKALRFLIPSDIRVFSAAQTAESRAWITAKARPRNFLRDRAGEIRLGLLENEAIAVCPIGERYPPARHRSNPPFDSLLDRRAYLPG